MMYYHGQISYSKIDNFVNNKAKDNLKYIVSEEKPIYNINLKDRDYIKIRSKINDWITIDIFSKVSKKHCWELIKKEANKIHILFMKLKEKEKNIY